MECPRCHENSSRVIDSRPSEDGHAIRRRRVCEKCKYRFTTFERVEQAPLLVIKNDGRRESYSRPKILRGMMMAAQKRPVSRQQLDEMVDHVDQAVHEQGESEIYSKDIGRLVLQELAKVDGVAYIRFASIYMQFSDVSNFKELVKNINNKHDQNMEEKEQ